MANTLTEVLPKLLAQGLKALRQQSIMPLLVNRAYESMAGQRGSTIDVPIPSSVTTQTVSPANTPPSTDNIAPTSVPIVLSQWKEAPFFLTDKDMLEAMNGTIPMQASEAVKSLANTVDSYILALYKKFYGYTGTAGTAPFGSGVEIASATGVRTTLNKQLAPMGDRRLVLDPDAEGAALNLRAFHDASFTGQTDAILKGQINERLGFGFFMDQNIPTHTAGTAITGGKTIQCVSASAAGVSSVTLKVTVGTGTLVEGDIITFAGHTQTYVVTADVTLDTSGVAVAIAPTLQTAVDGSSTPVVVTGKGSHVVNLGFHRDAIAFATRPLQSQGHPAALEQSVVDAVSGLTLRLEITREHKRTRFSYDVLYGAAVIRRELGSRLAG